MTVRNCYFHHNENGILGGTNEDGEIVVEHSEFAYNGHGDEGLKKGAHEFYFANNSVVNDGPRESRFIRVNSGTRQVTIVNNVFAGHGKLLEGVGK